MPSRPAAADIRGIDPAPEMIQRARRKAAAPGVEIRFDVGVIEELDLEADSFDAVLSSLMLHHLPPQTRRSGLVEILRVLKPGGRLVAVDFSGPGPLLHRLGSLLTSGRSQPKQQAERLEDEVRAVGFDDVVRAPMRPGLLFSLLAKKPDGTAST